MKERNALIAVIGSGMGITLLTLFALSWMGASSHLMAIAYVALLCLTADTTVRVALRYRR